MVETSADCASKISDDKPVKEWAKFVNNGTEGERAFPDSTNKYVINMRSKHFYNLKNA